MKIAKVKSNKIDQTNHGAQIFLIISANGTGFSRIISCEYPFEF
jgi:hypothetical protein